MPTSIFELPLHVLAEILRYAVTPDECYQRPQVSVIRVCSAFYLAGIPNIYRHPHVSSNLSSLFLHKPLPLPPSFDSLHSAELTRGGYTKLAALRYVQHLRIDIPDSYIAVDDEDMQMTDDQKAQFQQDQNDELNALLDAAEASLRDLPVGAIPTMESLQIGSMGRIFDHTPARRAADLAVLLLYRATPKIWCQYHGRVTPLAFPVFQLGGSCAPLPTLYRHTRLNYPFSILPGATTFLYIHRHSPPRVKGRPLCWRYREEAEATGRWIGLEIRDTLSLLKDCLDERTLGLIKATRVIIGGAVLPPSITAPRMASSMDGEIELQGAERVAAFARTALTAGTQAHLKEVRIEVRRAAEMPPCPACGERL